jgi:hypothetical protein
MRAFQSTAIMTSEALTAVVAPLLDGPFDLIAGADAHLGSPEI